MHAIYGGFNFNIIIVIISDLYQVVYNLNENIWIGKYIRKSYNGNVNLVGESRKSGEE